MKKLLLLLLIMSIIGILWLGSRFWEFKQEDYITPELVGESMHSELFLDLEFLKEEFGPAYEY